MGYNLGQSTDETPAERDADTRADFARPIPKFHMERTASGTMALHYVGAPRMTEALGRQIRMLAYRAYRHEKISKTLLEEIVQATKVPA